ncbi:MAG: hypothetical protein ACK5PS_09115 [Desulfopila sp.]
MVQTERQECRQCGCLPEEEHQPGCTAEECPVCGKMLVGCCCERLSPYDGERIIVGLYRQFRDLESALMAAGEEFRPSSAGSSYLQHAAMRYIFDHVPDEKRSELVRVFHLRFPGLVPQLQDDQGRGYYTAEQLAEALQMPLSEINERIEAMITAGQNIATGEGRKLHKVH